MEYLPMAKNLQSVIELGQISSETKKKYIEQICMGLKYCHSNGILHLDLKPKNILVLTDQRCKICDFGNSCKVGNEKNYVFQVKIIDEEVQNHEHTPFDYFPIV